MPLYAERNTAVKLKRCIYSFDKKRDMGEERLTAPLFNIGTSRPG